MFDNLIVLGTGHACCLHYKNTCFLMQNDDELFLVDGGGGHEILTSFTEHNIDWQKLHYAYLSHEHTDHLLGMVWVVRYITELMNWKMYDGDFTLYTHDVAAEKLLSICHMLFKPVLCELLETRVHIILVKDGERVQILGGDFTFFDIHSGKAKQFGFRAELPGIGTFVFSGDEPLDESCYKYAKNSDWLCLEAYCLYRHKDIFNPYELFHSTAKDSAECAKTLGAKRLILWHTEDEETFGQKKELYLEEAEEYFDGDIYIPLDDETIMLGENMQ